jgi:hypothetical protein
MIGQDPAVMSDDGEKSEGDTGDQRNGNAIGQQPEQGDPDSEAIGGWQICWSMLRCVVGQEC